MRSIYLAVFALSAVFSTPLKAATYEIPQDGSDIVGEMRIDYSRKGDTLTKIAMRHELGFNEIKKANPSIKRKRLRAGTPVIIPSAHVLPEVEREGLVVNVTEMRLFYFPTPDTVVTFPVAVGKRGWSTPAGDTFIKKKIRNPTWTPPASIRREAAKRGRKLRQVYRAGPNNPLGTRALRLGIPGYLIHGTNKPWSIGKRRSHGCIRMRKNDVESLYEQVEQGMQVKIVKQRSRRLELPESIISELQLSENQRYIAATQQPKPVKKAYRKRYKKKKVAVVYREPVVEKIPEKYIIPSDVFHNNNNQNTTKKATGFQNKPVKNKKNKSRKDNSEIKGGLDLL